MAARFWVGGSGTWDSSNTTNWSTTSGGAGGASVPVVGDSANFDSNSGAETIVSVDATATSTTVVINNPDITLFLNGSPTFAGATTLTTGTIALNSYTYTCSAFSSANTNERTINFGTGKIVLTASAGTIWNTSTATGLTISGDTLVECVNGGAGSRALGNGGSAGGSVAKAISFSVTSGADTVAINGFIKKLNFTGFNGTFTNQARTIVGDLTISAGMTLTAGAAVTTFAASASTQQITTNGVTLDFPLTFNGVGGTFAFQDALTQGSTRNFTLINGTVQIKNSVTSTVGNFLISSTNQKFLQSTMLGSQATLSQSSGTVNVSRLTIQDINATGGATWNAFVNQQNIDAGNNDGWDFGLSPIVGGNEYTYQLRSFTQPRRF